MSRPAPRPPRRPNRQQVAAAATRNEILLAARSLFGELGYAQTSIQAVAERAGVSVPTIYSSVGPKVALAKALVGMVDFRIAGAQARERLPSETDPLAIIALGAHVTRVLHENFGDIVRSLRDAAKVEPEVAEVSEMGIKFHDLGSRAMAERLAELGCLRAGLEVQEAADVIGLLTDHDCYESLVRRYGWSHDRAEAWVKAALVSLLLGTGGKQGGRGTSRRRP